MFEGRTPLSGGRATPDARDKGVKWDTRVFEATCHSARDRRAYLDELIGRGGRTAQLMRGTFANQTAIGRAVMR